MNLRLDIKILKLWPKLVDHYTYSISRSKTQGKYKGKDIKSMGMESITLKNTDTGWKITHIHWSN